jgi:hypothetical protein
MRFELTPKEKIKGLILPERINSDLAYFCGVLEGEGSIGVTLGEKYDNLTIQDKFQKDNLLVRNFIRGVENTDFHLRVRKKDNYPVICGVSKSEKFLL